MTPNSTPKYFEKPQQPIQSWGSRPGMKSQQNDNAIPDCHVRLIFIFVVQLIYKGGDVMLHTVEQGMSSSAWSEWTLIYLCFYRLHHLQILNWKYNFIVSSKKTLFIMSGFPSIDHRTVHHTQHSLSLGGQISTLTSQMSTCMKQDGLILFNMRLYLFIRTWEATEMPYLSENVKCQENVITMKTFFFFTWMNAQ